MVMRKNKHNEGDCFWGHEQAPQGFPLWDPGQTRSTARARRQAANRETRPQRLMSLRLRTAFSSDAALAAAVTTDPSATITFRWSKGGHLDAPPFSSPYDRSGRRSSIANSPKIQSKTVGLLV